MQGLHHWKANFRGFNLDIHRHFFDLTGHPSALCLCRPAIYCADRQIKVADRQFLLADDLPEHSAD